MKTRQGPMVRWTPGAPVASTRKLLIGTDGRRLWSISHGRDGTVTFAHIDESIPTLMTWSAAPGKGVVLSKPFDGVSAGVANKTFLNKMVPALRSLPPGEQRREYRKMLKLLKPAKLPSKIPEGMAQPTLRRMLKRK